MFTMNRLKASDLWLCVRLYVKEDMDHQHVSMGSY